MMIVSEEEIAESLPETVNSQWENDDLNIDIPLSNSSNTKTYRRKKIRFGVGSLDARSLTFHREIYHLNLELPVTRVFNTIVSDMNKLKVLDYGFYLEIEAKLMDQPHLALVTDIQNVNLLFRLMERYTMHCPEPLILKLLKAGADPGVRHINVRTY